MHWNREHLELGSSLFSSFAGPPCPDPATQLSAKWLSSWQPWAPAGLGHQLAERLRLPPEGLRPCHCGKWFGKKARGPFHT